MFLRRNRRQVKGEYYEYWTLVKTVRTAHGPRQEIVACLGKTPGLDRRTRHGWEAVADLLEGRTPAVQGQLGENLSATPPAQWAQVDLRGVRVERVRDFGQIYLALSLWRRLGLHTLLQELLEAGQEEVPWELTACILTVARFCGQRSELEVAERWYADSALEDLLGVPFGHINDARLYRGLAVLHAHKDQLCAHLLKRYQDWFGVEFEFLLYDVTSTYFEGQALGNEKATRGYSRDHRPDCKQVTSAWWSRRRVCPWAMKSSPATRPMSTTVEDMVELMENKYGQAKRIWVMDRGMIREDNLDFLRARQARYLVGTSKSQLKPFEKQLLEKENWTEVQAGVEVKLVPHPDGGTEEQFVLCRSAARREKEAAMIQLARQRLRAQLDQTHAALQKRPARDPGRFLHEDITGLKPDQICKKGISKTFQIAKSFPGLTALECTMIGALFGNQRKISMAEAGKEAVTILDFVGFPAEKRETSIKNLNVVELKSVQLARALATQPRLLLLDELTTGLNPKESKEAVELIKKIRRNGVSILIIEHVMSVIMGVSDRIVVLDHGEKIADGRPYEVVNDQRVIDTYLGEIDAF